MENEFTDHEQAFSDINEALAELFDAADVLDSIGAGLPEGARPAVRSVRGKLGRAANLLDRPWPMLSGHVVDGAA